MHLCNNPLGVHPARAGISRRTSFKPYAGFGEIVRSIFDFESWAPRSSRQWRLRPVPGEAITKADLPNDDMDLLQQLRQRQEALGSVDTASDTLGMPDDRDLQRSLTARVNELGGGDVWSPTTPLTGAVLQALVLAKYGTQYDLSIVKRDIPGRTLVRLNVMWQHTKQVSFAMTPQEFDDKMETIAYYIRAWKQEAVVRDFFSKPPRPSRGLPARPVPGSAVSIKLDVDQAMVEEWFGGR